MMSIAIYTLTSELHDEQVVSVVTEQFLHSLHLEYEFRGSDFSDYGSHALDLIYIRTGGTEGLFKGLLPELQRKSYRPFFLLTSGKSNSLAASLEILSYLRQQGLKGEVLHGSADYIKQRVMLLQRVGEAMKQLHGSRLGVIGEPSDWLISSGVAPVEIRRQLGIQLVHIPMLELQVLIEQTPEHAVDESSDREEIRQALPGAVRIYEALRLLVEKHRLQGFTIRCFDLLRQVQNTGCLALARLNEERDGWYEGTLDFKRVVLVPGTGKHEYRDTHFVADCKAVSGLDCYNRIVDYLQGRVDHRSQFPSSKGKNFKFKYLGMWK